MVWWRTSAAARSNSSMLMDYGSRGKTFRGRACLAGRLRQSLKRAEEIVKCVGGQSLLHHGHGRTSMPSAARGVRARLHMSQRGYPMLYAWLRDPRKEMAEFLRHVQCERGRVSQIGVVSDARAPAGLLRVLEHLVRVANQAGCRLRPRRSRRAALFGTQCAGAEARPLLTAARELNVLRSRSPEHGEDLIAWTIAHDDGQADDTPERNAYATRLSAV